MKASLRIGFQLSQTNEWKDALMHFGLSQTTKIKFCERWDLSPMSRGRSQGIRRSYRVRITAASEEETDEACESSDWLDEHGEGKLTV